MQEETIVQPTVSFIGDEIVISLPAWMREKKKSVRLEWRDTDTVQKKAQRKEGSMEGIKALRGCLADVPEFKGKTSTEVKHMITDIWAKMASS